MGLLVQLMLSQNMQPILRETCYKSVTNDLNLHKFTFNDLYAK